jgi:anti-repressor protein
MEALQIFTSPEFGQIRIVKIEGEPYFVGRDVAEALGYSNTRDALATHVQNDDKNTVVISDGKRGNPNQTVINESGTYALIFGSKLESAQRFKHWVTAKVLPTIRKHGMYATDDLLNDPDLAIRAFTALKEERERSRRLIADNRRMKPKEIFADAVSTSNDVILIGALAKIIKQNGVDIGQKRLFEWMRVSGYLMKAGRDRNLPTQKAMDLGLYQIKERTINNPDGSVRITKTVLVTGKGQQYFINKFLGRRNHYEMDIN